MLVYEFMPHGSLQDLLNGKIVAAVSFFVLHYDHYSSTSRFNDINYSTTELYHVVNLTLLVIYDS